MRTENISPELKLLGYLLSHCRTRRAQVLWLTPVLIIGFFLIGSTPLLSAGPFASVATPKIEKLNPASLSEQVSVRAAGRGNPWINLSDGHKILSAYSGPAELKQRLEQNQTRPLSLASADYDEDGVPDLIVGYSDPTGGIITLHRGNVDSIYPNAPEAQQRRANSTFTDSPFLSPAHVFAAPEAADFLGAGDFDGDGHWDIVVSARGGNKLYLMSGDGQGGLAAAKSIELTGGVTALVIGEINRRDGLEDVVVGISGRDGSSVLVFEGPQGALRARPEVLNLPAEATSLALGQLDDDYAMDLAVAAGHELLIVRGRDRKLSLDEETQAKVAQAEFSHHSFPYSISLVAVGDFTGDNKVDIALLSDDGTAHLLWRTVKGERQKPDRRLKEWNSRVLAGGNWPKATQLVSARMSSIPVDDLVVVDPTNRSIHILVGDTSTQQEAVTKTVAGIPDRTISSSLLVEGDPVAVLPMRLNGDALSDLVILKSGQIAPIISETAAAMTFTVTTTEDSGDNQNPTPGSLREAILKANSNPGADMINFNIPGDGPHTIRPPSFLPEILNLTLGSGPVTIDGTTQPGFSGKPIIELSGPSAELNITAGNCTVRGLVINLSRGIVLIALGGNVVEGNFIGTDITGTAELSGGVTLFGSNNIIGGTTPAARNVISGIFVASSTNQVRGNYIGIDVTGTAILNHVVSDGRIGLNIGNGDFIASNNTIGGTMAGARNVISGNKDVRDFPGLGILLRRARGNLVQGNFIGTDFTGTTALSNDIGVSLISDANASNSSNLVGGTTPAARNIISGNGAGVNIVGIDTTGNRVEGNYIGTDVTGTTALGNSGNGVAITFAPGNTIGGAVKEAGNVIASNGGNGVAIGIRGINPNTGMPLIGQTGAQVQGNFIGTDVTGMHTLGNGEDGILVNVESSANVIAGNLIAFNNRNGINIPNITSDPGNPGVRIAILSNSIYSNGALGIELGNDGVTENDNRDIDTGANQLQNFPVLTSATSSVVNPSTTGAVLPATVTTINVMFNSTPNSTFNIQFFLSSSCPSEGPQSINLLPILVGNKEVTTNSNGDVSFTFSFELPSAVSSGFVNATATSLDGNTSEFSRCFEVGAPIAIPRITSATRSSKKLFVSGENFDNRAKILINGMDQKTIFESAIRLIGKKAGKKVKSGDKLQVRNSDGTLSPEFIYIPQ